MNKKIFIIEDDANILYSLQAKLSVAGFHVATETGSEEILVVLRRIKDYKPDLIILDLILPKIDGFELLRGLKADQETLKMPVYIFTNLSDEDSRQRGLNLGAEQYFVKNDFNIDSLVAKIKKIFENKIEI